MAHGIRFINWRKNQCAYLGLEQFVVSKKEGGFPIPTIAPVQEYVDYYLSKEAAVEGMEGAASPKKGSKKGEPEPVAAVPAMVVPLRTRKEMGQEVLDQRARLAKAKIEEARCEDIVAESERMALEEKE